MCLIRSLRRSIPPQKCAVSNSCAQPCESIVGFTQCVHPSREVEEDHVLAAAAMKSRVQPLRQFPSLCGIDRKLSEALLAAS